MIALDRHLLKGDALVRSGSHRGWRPVLYAGGMSGRDVGIVGMGAVGQAIARRLRGFDTVLRYTDPTPLPPAEETRLGARRVALDTLLGDSSVVMLAAPLGNDTRHLIDGQALDRMRAGALLVKLALCPEAVS